MSAVRRRVVVDGRVQGVFFRETCRREADAAGAGGWVKNRPDGKVEAVFEGPPEAVERLVDWCREGPPSARVVRVTVQDEAPRGDQRFRVIDD